MHISILDGNHAEPGGTIIYRYVFAHRDVLEPIWGRMRRTVGKQGGRPSVSRYRAVEAIIWVFLTRGRWMDLPPGFVNGKTAHRTYKYWSARGLWNDLLFALASRTPTGQALGLSRCFADGQLVRALAFEEVVELVQEPGDGDPNRTWMLLLFLSPLGSNRLRIRGPRKQPVAVDGTSTAGGPAQEGATPG